MSNFDKIPIELTPLIFQHLDVRDLPSCRLVCKKWKFFIDEIKPTELIVQRERNLSRLLNDLYLSIRNENNEKGNFWLNTNRPFNLRNRIFVPKFTTFHSFPYSLQNLKYLLVKTKICLENSLAMLNSLTNLEHFEAIDLRLNCKTATTVTLTLPNLRTLYIDHLDWDHFGRRGLRKMLFIDSSKLKTIRYNSEIMLIKLIQPNTVERLEFEFYNADQLYLFENVKYFQCDSSFTMQSDVLECLTALEELHCNEKGSFDYKEEYFEMETVLDEIIQKRVVLNRENVKIYFNGQLLDGGLKKFRDYGFHLDYGINYDDTSNYSESSSFDSESDSENDSTSSSSDSSSSSSDSDSSDSSSELNIDLFILKNLILSDSSFNSSDFSSTSSSESDSSTSSSSSSSSSSKD